MNIYQLMLLFGVGIATGVISTVAGGASIVALPALLNLGIAPVTAVASNAVSLMPGTLLSIFMERSQVQVPWKRIGGMAVVAAAGSVVGAFLLLVTPTRLLDILIPILLAAATLAYAFSSRISCWLRGPIAGSSDEIRISATGLFPISIYGGYFGAGLGVVLLAALTIASHSQYRQVNPMKNLLSAVIGIVAAVLFIVQNAVHWPTTLVLAVGGLVGSYLGVLVARSVPGIVIKTGVIAIGFFLTTAYAWRYWH